MKRNKSADRKKKITKRLLREDQNRLVRYFRFENTPFVSREQLVSGVQSIGIDASIPELLRCGLIQVVYRNCVYGISELKGTVNQLLPVLFEKDGPYYLGGLAAFHRLGFVDQVPNWYTVVNTRRSGLQQRAGFKIQFRKRKIGFFYGINSDGLPDSDRAAIDFCDAFGFSRWWRLIQEQPDVFNLDRMQQYAIRYPINRTARRVLYGLQQSGVVTSDDAKRVSTRSLIALEDGMGRGGKIDKRWGIIVSKS